MGTDPILTAMTFHRCMEVDREKTDMKDGLVSQDFPTGKVNYVNEESV